MSNNNHLENLCLSYGLYKNLLKRFPDSYQANNHSEEVITAARKLELLLKFLLVKSFFWNLNNLASYYNAWVKVDWTEFFSYFDLLDVLIISKYEESEYDHCTGVIVAASNTIEYSNLYIVAKTAYSKLNKLAERIVIELYRDQFSINHYANIDLESLKETSFLDEAMVYLHFFKGKDQDLINDYVGLDLNNQNYRESAQFYFTAAMNQSKHMYHQYGEKISECLHVMWNSSCVDRLMIVKCIKDAQFANVAEEMPGYNPKFCDYFSLCECLTFWWQSQYVKKPAKENIAFCSQAHLDMVFDLTKAEPGSDLVADIMTLYSYLMPLEVLATEYICFQYYAVTGVKRDLAAHARDVSNSVRQLCSASTLNS